MLISYVLYTEQSTDSLQLSRHVYVVIRVRKRNSRHLIRNQSQIEIALCISDDTN